MSLSEMRRFDAQREVYAELRGFVEDFCAAAGARQSMIDVLMLICEELFENSTRHGYKGAPDGTSAQPIWLSLTLSDRGINTVYEDAAPAFNPLANVRPPDYSGPPETWKVGGLGIPLITQLARDLNYVYTGERNRISFTVPFDGMTC